MQGFGCPRSTFSPAHARERERKLHVGEDGLVGNQVITLENKPDAVIAVGVPVTVGVVRSVDAIND